MDIFSADLPVDAFSQVPDAARAVRRSTVRRGTDRRGARRGRAPVLSYAGGGVLVGACDPRAGGACRSARRAGGAHADGQGVPPRGSPAAARADRLLGHADLERQMPHGRSHRRRGHASRGSELELVGSAVHVLHSADAADSHRRRRSRDRPQLPHRARRGRRRQARARHAGRRSRWDVRIAIAAGCATRSRAGGRRSPRTGITSGARISIRCGRSGFSRS